MVTSKVRIAKEEVLCPACGASIRLTSRTGEQRVQCPRCREIVNLPSPGDGPIEKPAKKEDDNLRALIKRLDDLETRVRTLEKAAAEIAPTDTAPAEDVAPVPPVPAGQESLFEHLRACSARMINIRVAENNEEAAGRAAELKQVFESAGWKVHGPEPVPHGGKGLFFSVGAIPMPAAVAETHIALTCSGLDLISRLDPDLGPEDSALIIA